MIHSVVPVYDGGTGAKSGLSPKLYYACKVWGFVNYFHAGLSTFQVNWDSLLVRRLPHIKHAVTAQILIMSIRAQRDEVLEKALQIANCSVGIKRLIQELTGVVVYPNPASTELRVVSSLERPVDYELNDVLGKTMVKHRAATLEFMVDVSGLTPGIISFGSARMIK